MTWEWVESNFQVMSEELEKGSKVIVRRGYKTEAVLFLEIILPLFIFHNILNWLKDFQILSELYTVTFHCV